MAVLRDKVLNICIIGIVTQCDVANGKVSRTTRGRRVLGDAR